ncbi:MAG: Rieske (2Fe-2S) protein [Candidatus Dormibacteraeota bacterium]|nr:Rieske (2Fe-2S) protein [Candidatus Dormibacteraeota bacterium]
MKITRRRFAIAGTQLAGAAVATMLGVPIVGWLVNPLVQSQGSVIWRRLARLSDLQVEVPTQFSVPFPHQSAWTATEDHWIVFAVRYRDGSLRTFSNVCTHMQCPVRWETATQQFLCPCHGGLYDISGSNVGGPPPEPLPEWQHHVDGQGVIYVSNRLSENLP